MAGDVTEMVPHAIPHDGTPVTYDMASLTRRRQRYRATGNTACDLRHGIRARAEIRRRLSGERYIRRHEGVHALAFSPGCKGGIAADTPRLRKRKAPDTPFYGYRFPPRLHDAWQRGRKLPKYSRDTPLRISEVSSSCIIAPRRKT